MKTKNLLSIYKLLAAGNIVQIRGKRGGVIVWRALGNRGDREYLFWQSFGQSATRLGINNLRWIAKTIGESSKYEYKVVDGVYSIPSWYE